MSEQETKKKISSTTVVTGVVRFSYLHVFEKWGVEGAQEEDKRYGVQLLIQKKDKPTLNKIENAIKEAIKTGEAKLKNKQGVLVKAGLKLPLRDGDEDPEKVGLAEYKDSYFINCNTNRKPGVVDKKVQPILDPDSVYSGGYGRACISLYAFNKNGKKGIAAGLQHVQWVRDGEPLGGGISAEAAFEEYNEGDENSNNEDDDKI